jgi:hypothetical protein
MSLPVQYLTCDRRHNSARHGQRQRTTRTSAAAAAPDLNRLPPLVKRLPGRGCSR